MIVFRVEASQQIGFGHLKRSAYLASLLKGQTPVLFCINPDKTALRFLQERGFDVCTLKQVEDVRKPEVNCIVFDLRSDVQEDKQLLKWAKKNKVFTLQITDLGLNQKAVHMTIDGTLDTLEPYPPKTHLMQGPEYMILHHKIRHFHQVKRKYRKKIRRVFLCLGGGIEYRLLRRTIDQLSRSQFQLKIASGYYLKNSHRKILRRIYPNIRFVGPTESLGRCYHECDLALISSGITACEAAAAGTPALYVHHHQEQEFIADSLEKRGVGIKLSSVGELKMEEMMDKIQLFTFDRRLEMGTKGKELIDGLGVYRIIDFLKNKRII